MALKAKLIGEAGRPYGHVPGHQFLDVMVYKRKSDFMIRIEWGSSRGHDIVEGQAEYARPTLAEARDRALEDVGSVAKKDHESRRKFAEEAIRYIETACSKARGRGRPPEESKTRTGQLPRVRVTAALDADVHARANKDKIDVSELVRRALVRYLES